MRKYDLTPNQKSLISEVIRNTLFKNTPLSLKRSSDLAWEILKNYEKFISTNDNKRGEKASQ